MGSVNGVASLKTNHSFPALFRKNPLCLLRFQRIVQERAVNEPKRSSYTASGPLLLFAHAWMGVLQRMKYSFDIILRHAEFAVHIQLCHRLSQVFQR